MKKKRAELADLARKYDKMLRKAGVNVRRNGSKKMRKFKGFEFPRLDFD